MSIRNEDHRSDRRATSRLGRSDAARHAAGEALPVADNGRPRGHVVGRPVAEPLPVSVDARPRGHVVGRPVAEPLPVSGDSRPRGHVVGRSVGEPLPSFDDTRPRGHVVGRAGRQSIMGLPATAPGGDVMGLSDRPGRGELMGRSHRGRRLLGGPDRRRIELMGEGEPRFVDSLFTGVRR